LFLISTSSPENIATSRREFSDWTYVTWFELSPYKRLLMFTHFNDLSK